MCLGRLHVVTGLNADTQSLSVLYLFLGSDDVTLPFQFRRRGKVPVDILSVGAEQFCRVCPFEPVDSIVQTRYAKIPAPMRQGMSPMSIPQRDWMK